MITPLFIKTEKKSLTKAKASMLKSHQTVKFWLFCGCSMTVLPEFCHFANGGESTSYFRIGMPVLVSLKERNDWLCRVGIWNFAFPYEVELEAKEIGHVFSAQNKKQSLQLELLQRSNLSLEVQLKAEQAKKPKDRSFVWLLRVLGAFSIGWMLGS